MKNRIPEVPKQFTVPQETINDRNKYIDFLENISPRIKVVRSEELTEHKFSQIEISFKKDLACARPEEIRIRNWPQQEDVALVVLLNSSMTEEPIHLVKDSFIFCYDDYAFNLSINAFEQEEATEGGKFIYQATGDVYKEDWEKAVQVIKGHLKIIEEKVKNYIPPLPKG